MTLAEVLAWIWSGHRHRVISTGLAPALIRGEGRTELVKVERCECGAIRPVDGSWVRPLEDR